MIAQIHYCWTMYFAAKYLSGIVYSYNIRFKKKKFYRRAVCADQISNSAENKYV